jgi:hypothetical protein
MMPSLCRFSKSERTASEKCFRDGWIVTLNRSGAIVKMKGYGGQETDWFNSVTEVTKDHFLLAGNAVSSDGDVIGQHNHRTGTQYKDGWIIYY